MYYTVMQGRARRLQNWRIYRHYTYLHTNGVAPLPGHVRLHVPLGESRVSCGTKPYLHTNRALAVECLILIIWIQFSAHPWDQSAWATGLSEMDLA